jgi:hypothetical protein
MDKYVVDLHGNYAPSQGNRTIATSYLAQSIQATAAACQVLAGTPGREPYHQVIRMAETLGPEGAKLTALEDHWIDTYLAPCLVRVHKQAEAGCSMFQLCDCIKAYMVLLRSFLRALPWWLEKQGSGYPLLGVKAVQRIKEHEHWPAFHERMLWACRAQEEAREGKRTAHNQETYSMPRHAMLPLPFAAPKLQQQTEACQVAATPAWPVGVAAVARPAAPAVAALAAATPAAAAGTAAAAAAAASDHPAALAAGVALGKATAALMQAASQALAAEAAAEAAAAAAAEALAAGLQAPAQAPLKALAALKQSSSQQPPPRPAARTPRHQMATSGHPQRPQQHLFLLGTWHSPTQQAALTATQLDLQQQVIRPCGYHSSSCCSRRSSRFRSLPATAAAGSARRTWPGQQPWPTRGAG